MGSMRLNGCFRKWWYPQIIHFNRVFHYIQLGVGSAHRFLGLPHFRCVSCSLALSGRFMGSAWLLIWIWWSLSFFTGGEVSGTVVAQKGQGETLCSSKNFPRVVLGKVVQKEIVENCNNPNWSPRFNFTKQGLATIGRTVSSHDHVYLDLPILQSSFASECYPLYSMLETLETSAIDEQIEEPQNQRQGPCTIQTDDSKTQFEKWSTRRSGGCGRRRTISGQSSLGDFFAPDQSDGFRPWGSSTDQSSGRNAFHWNCSRQSASSSRTDRSRSAHAPQSAQESFGTVAGVSGGATTILRGQSRQDVDTWSHQQIGQASKAVVFPGHQDFRNGPQLEGVHGEGDTKVWSTPTNVSTVPSEASPRVSAEKPRDSSCKGTGSECIGGHVPNTGGRATAGSGRLGCRGYVRGCRSGRCLYGHGARGGRR